MANYVDRTGLEQRFGVDEIAQLLDDALAGAETAEEVASLTRAVEDATTLIDGYLAARYTLPLLAVPLIVTNWAADIARYRLWDERAPTEVRRRYEDTLKQLELLAKGVIALPPDTSGASAVTPIEFSGYGNTRVFTEDTLADY
jgi:phage gp36-like protein